MFFVHKFENEKGIRFSFANLKTKNEFVIRFSFANFKTKKEKTVYTLTNGNVGRFGRN